MKNSNSGACLTNCQQARCGDGERRTDGIGADEECDLGALNSDSGKCLTNCKMHQCGDGHVYEDHEKCDDGNGLDCGTCLGNCSNFTQKATGYIVTMPARDFYDNTGDPNSYDSFTISKLPNQPYSILFIYTFRDPPPPSSGTVQIHLTSLSLDATAVANLTASAISGVGQINSNINVTNKNGLITLTAKEPDRKWNLEIAENVTNRDFIAMGMAGGSGSGLCAADVGCDSGADCKSGMCDFDIMIGAKVCR